MEAKQGFILYFTLSRLRIPNYTEFYRESYEVYILRTFQNTRAHGGHELNSFICSNVTKHGTQTSDLACSWS